MDCYCEKCRRLFAEEGRLCPVCGSRKVRCPRVDDPCFLVERGAPWDEMLADVLTRNRVSFAREPVLGAGLALNLGQGMERWRFYVPYSQLPRASSLVAELFGE